MKMKATKPSKLTPKGELSEKLKLTAEDVEQAIVNISEGFSALSSSNLSEETIILLVQNAAGPRLVNKDQVRAVLRAARDLRRQYLKR